MKKNSITRIKAIFLLAAVFLVTLSILSFIRIKKLIEVSQWVNHTHVVKLNLESTFSSLLDMETSQRGYLLTRDTMFLKAYYRKGNILTQRLSLLDSVTRDNIIQHINIVELKNFTEKRRIFLQEVLDSSNNGRIPVQKIVKGKTLMRNIRDQINKMEREEDYLLNRRELLLSKETFLTPLLALCFTLSSIIVLITAYFKIINDLKLSNALKLEVEKTNQELELKNKELSQRELQFFNMFDYNPVALSFGEIGSNKIIYANKLFYSYFGYTKEEVVGRTSEQLKLVSPEENARLLPIILSYLEETRSIEELRALPPEEMEKLLFKLREKMFSNGFEVLYTRKNKETFYALVFYEIIEIGNKKYALTSYQDITERKKAEQKVEKQNAELVKMNKELESFNYISSHDLQEPLRKIQMFSSQILEKDHDNLSDKGKDLFRRMQDSANKMRILIDDLLAYSRTNAADRTFEKINLNTIVNEIKEDLKDEIQQKNAIIEVGTLCEIKVITFQMRQLIYNLVSNSLKFSSSDRPLVIKIASEQNKGAHYNEKLETDVKYCHISISDNGIGFEPQYSEKIFEVFQRLHRKNEFKGTGIGLAIVKKIVENHNGMITATGEPDKGGTFDIYIPVIE